MEYLSNLQTAADLPKKGRISLLAVESLGAAGEIA